MSNNNAGHVIKIGNSTIKEGHPPYIIAEIGVNHEGCIEKAFKMVELAAQGGANAVKFQSYKAETLASRNSPSYWDLNQEPTTSQFELFKRYDCFEYDGYLGLAHHCKLNNVDFISTPFDLQTVDFLAPLMPCFKVASADITNYPLLEKIGECAKPILLSTGASTIQEIKEAIAILNNLGCRDIILLHCILNYPTSDNNAHLGMIKGLRREFPQYIVGYSDHTVPDTGMTALSTAFLFGALVLEKHFTYNKKLPGNDHYHAMDINDLKQLSYQLKKIRELEGCLEKKPLESEINARLNARRSIVLKKGVNVGQALKEEHLICKRPGFGISAANYNEVVGMVAKDDLEEDHILSWNDITRQKKKIIAVIQARMNSKRFPGKIMAKLAGFSVIEWVLNRVNKAGRVDEVVLALPDCAENDILEEKGKQYGITVVRGSEGDVLSRFVTSARMTKADVVVRVCADNPLICPDEIDRLIEFFLANHPDYAFNHINKLGNNYPDGLGAEIFSRSVLEELNTKSIIKQHREHVTAYIWDNLSSYNVLTFQAPEQIAFPNVKLDIDYEKDLFYLQQVINTAASSNNEMSVPLFNISSESVLRVAINE